MMDYDEEDTYVLADGAEGRYKPSNVVIWLSCAGIAAGSIGALFVADKLGRLWRSRKMQEEYNKIWDEYKYRQGEESAE